jgi:hypothetical protein
VVPVGEVVAALIMFARPRSGSRGSQPLPRAKTSPLLMSPVTLDRQGVVVKPVSLFLEQAAI